MDGFDVLGQTKIIMATNRPDTLDPALLRPGRLDRKIEIPLPNEQGRLEVLKIHASKITKHGDIGRIVLIVDYEAVVKLSEGFNGADLRNVCTEAGTLMLIFGMFAIREEREYVIQEDFMKAVRKVAAAKKLEGKLDCKYKSNDSNIPWLDSPPINEFTTIAMNFNPNSRSFVENSLNNKAWINRYSAAFFHGFSQRLPRLSLYLS
jgi:SpoVK/Ycf46/Vps4 family AAA+-type ATPase